MGRHSTSASIDGEISVPDIYRDDYNSSLNQKSSSTAFHFDYDKEREEIAKDDTVQIKYVRTLVVIVITLLAAAVCLWIFIHERRIEISNFEDAYEEGAELIGQNFERKIGLHVRAMDSLGLHVTSWASGANQTWPNVTVPDFDLHGVAARGFSNSLSILLTPVIAANGIHTSTTKVTTNQRVQYEQYTQQNQQWIFEALERRNNSKEEDEEEKTEEVVEDNVMTRQQDVSISDVVFRIGDDNRSTVPETGSGPIFPVWSMTPIVPTLINYNLASQTMFNEEIVLACTSQQMVLGQSFNILNGLSSLETLLIPNEDKDDNVNNDDEDDKDAGLPVSNLYVPIFDDIDSTSKLVVGMMTSTFLWTSILENIIPPDHGTFLIQIDNTCGQRYQFRTRGGDDNNNNNLEFGGSDGFNSAWLDDSEYQYRYDVSESFPVKEYLFPGSVLELNKGTCQYTLHVYPTDELRKSFLTRNPLWYTLSVVFVFMVTALVFGCYDLIMERRQKKVLTSAVEARAIVASLFPRQVRGRLFERQRKKDPESRKMGEKQKSLLNLGGRQVRFKDVSRRNVIMGGGASVPSEADHTGTGTVGGDTIHHNNMHDESASNFSYSRRRSSLVSQSTLRIKSYLNGSSSDMGLDDKISRPIADLFPHTTVLFGDIVGFTAWCSQRDPEQVFMLLESIYKAFDKVSRKRGVFKVETIGDCYVAVTGLPDPQRDHAWRMAKFALDCRNKMVHVLSDLENALGPDTSDLCMRFGMHSGPTTAGVLRGDKSRFQLFGDTVNTASRMESTGEPNRIQLSQTTVDALKEVDKGSWVRPRDDLVQVKGKGLVKTYWLASRPNDRRLRPTEEVIFSKGDRRRLEFYTGGRQISTRMALSSHLSDDEEDSDDDDSDDDMIGFANAEGGNQANDENGQMSTLFEEPGTDEAEKEEEAGPEPELSHAKLKTRRKVILWQAELLLRALKVIVARRGGIVKSVAGIKLKQKQSSKKKLSSTSIPLDEVVESIELPEFDALALTTSINPEEVVLSPVVVAQLHDYVGVIASMYPENEFHNFEHASHVAMAVTKLLGRIVVPDCVDVKIALELHHSSDGINSDPLTQFAVVFAALIHDVDHPGVTNSQLAKEDPQLATTYRNKSIAEQKSIDIAWELLMDSKKYLDLRACIYSNEAELRRFRNLVVNCVMATDIFDKDMKQFRKERWEKVFGEDMILVDNDNLNDTTDTTTTTTNNNNNINNNSSSRNALTMSTKSVTEDGDDDGDGNNGAIMKNEGNETDSDETSDSTLGNKRATTVIELISQVSDLAHTMQHWHVFRKWNERLFKERLKAYQRGRSDVDPCKTWYEDELQFFDNYVIPMAKLLEKCEYFGVASNECLSYAIENRNEWEAKGKRIVEEMSSNHNELVCGVYAGTSTNSAIGMSTNSAIGMSIGGGLNGGGGGGGIRGSLIIDEDISESLRLEDLIRSNRSNRS